MCVCVSKQVELKKKHVHLFDLELWITRANWQNVKKMGKLLLKKNTKSSYIYELSVISLLFIERTYIQNKIKIIQ